MAVFTPGVPVVATDPVVSVEGLAPGTHRFRLEVEDEAGNRSAADERTVVVRVAAPAITALQPGWGDWGDEVRIVGTGFDPEPAKNQPAFSADVPTGVGAGTPTQLTVRVPQPAVTGRVTVRTGNGVATSPRPFIVPRGFTVQARGTPLLDLAAEPARNEVWVLHGVPGTQAGLVSMISLERRGVVGVLEVQNGPREIAISGRELARAAVSNGAASTVTLIDVGARRVLAQVKVSPGPAGLAFQPGGTVLYVACSSSAAATAAALDSVDVVSLAPNATAGPRVIARIPLERGAARVVFSPDGKLAFVNETAAGTVAMIDTAAHRVVDRFKVGGSERSAPSEVAVSADTFPLLVANPGTNSGSVIDARGNVRDLDIGFPVAAAAIGPTGGWLSGPAETVAMFVDFAALRLRKAEAAGSGAGPKSIVVVPGAAGGIAPGIVVASTGAPAASVIEPRSRLVQAVARQPDGPVRTVLSADGAFAVFIGQRSPAVSVLELASVLPA